VRSSRFGTLAAVGAAVSLVIGCQAATPTPSSTDGPTPAPSGSSQPLPTLSTPLSTPTAAARWIPAGFMSLPRSRTHGVLLGDGRVLVVGNEGYYVTDDAVNAELWDPATDSWQLTMSLNKPRGDFAAVPLADGRALVTGGYNQVHQSYSSTYLFDPQRVAGGSAKGWSASGLLGKARTAPAAAVLSDGRVLVAGGYFRLDPDRDQGRVADGALARYRAGPVPRRSLIRGAPYDLEPQNVGAAMATAELFDPATGRWSDTGPLKYARSGAAAVTLTDGRVLVVGSGPGESGVTLDEHAFDTAELYDPATGRFRLTGGLPEIDRAGLEGQAGSATVPVPESDPMVDDVGTLVALDDGGAVLVGHSAWWKHVGEITRSFRYDARTENWTEIGQTYIYVSDNGPARAPSLKTVGVRRLTGAMVARLPDGRVLVAGGAGAIPEGSPYSNTYTATTAEAYDPATNTWSALPPMPEARAGGAIVALADGSVLLVGGYSDPPPPEGLDRVILASATRFVPAP